MDVYTWLIVGHLAGTILGIGGATMVEVHLTTALRNKDMSSDERVLLGTDYTVVRVGLILSVLTGFGFLLLYNTTGQTFRLYDPILWAKLCIVMAIAINALLLQAHKISLYWGAALSFVSWWSAGLLGVFLTHVVKFDLFGMHTFLSSFVSVMLMYALMVVVGAAVLDLVRKRLSITS